MSFANKSSVVSLLTLLTVPALTAAGEAILVFTKTTQYRHESIPAGVRMLRELGGARGLAIEHTENAAVFEDAALDYASVVFLSTTGDILDERQQRGLEEYIRNGGAFVGIHAAADTEHDWPWYGELVGAWFEHHPAIQPAAIDVADREHPSTRMLPSRWKRTDEWYDYHRNPRGDVHVLMTLDESTYQGGRHDGDHPIAWCRWIDGGRSWYTGLGHTEESYAEALFRQHVLGGILWAVGAAEGGCAGSGESEPRAP